MDNQGKFKILLLIFSLSFIPVFSNGQDTVVYEKWDKMFYTLANTAVNANYLNNIEKQVVLLCNMARINPSLFANTFLKNYIDSNEAISKNSFVKSLNKDLNSMAKVQVLSSKEDLSILAGEHALNMGTSGRTGHDGYNKRMKKVSSHYNCLGENCDYGNNEALAIVMSLLIDQDIVGVGHRKNILNKDFNSIGVSIQPHKKYEYNCVIEFGELVEGHVKKQKITISEKIKQMLDMKD